MVICIPTKNENGLNSRVYGHFGSAPFFAIFDSNSNQVQFLDNSNSNHVHGQCNPVGQLKNYNIEAVIVSGMGMNALKQLNNFGIKVYKLNVPVTVSELIKNFNNYLNEELSFEDCCTHHGTHHNINI